MQTSFVQITRGTKFNILWSKHLLNATFQEGKCKLFSVYFTKTAGHSESNSFGMSKKNLNKLRRNFCTGSKHG